MKDSSVPRAVRDRVLKSFYVDDLTSSVDSENTAIELIAELSALISLRGFNLTDWVSNSPKMTSSVPNDKVAKCFGSTFNGYDDSPCESALGVKWNVLEDSISFTVTLRDQPCTRRGVISTIFSIFDPLFLQTNCENVFFRSVVRRS